MRRIISLMIALVLCISLACPAFAATKPFVPSISYKDGPDIVDAAPHGDCLIVTTIPQAKDKITDIYQDDRELLIDVYEKLSDGTMKAPVKDDYVIRDLVDVSWKKSTCVETDHGHKEWLKEEDATIKVTFDLGLKKNTEVIVMVYLDGEWVPVEGVKNNDDGTVTVELEDIGPVAFCVKRTTIQDNPKSGDPTQQNLTVFIVLMIASAAGLTVLLILRHKKRK